MILVIGCNRVSQVTYVKGYGRFTDANTIEVQGINGQTTVWKTKNTIIATGSEPVELPFMKFNDDGDKTCVSSTGALVLPRSHCMVCSATSRFFFGWSISSTGTTFLAHTGPTVSSLPPPRKGSRLDEILPSPAHIFPHSLPSCPLSSATFPKPTPIPSLCSLTRSPLSQARSQCCSSSNLSSIYSGDEMSGIVPCTC